MMMILSLPVMPAKAGIQTEFEPFGDAGLDPSLRWGDEGPVR